MIKKFLMNKLSLQKISEYSFLFLPIALITGPFLSEICIFIISIFAINEIIKNKNYEILKSRIILGLFIFYIILILSSLLSDFKFYSLKTSLPYIRFIFFSIGALFILNSNQSLKKKYFYVLFFCFLILSIGGIYEFVFKKFCTGYVGDDINALYRIEDNFIFCKDFLLVGNLLRADRLSSFFGDEMVLGSYLARLFPLFIFLFYSINLSKNKINYHYLFFVIIVFTIVMSGERVALFYNILLILTVFIFAKISNKKKIVSFILLLMLASVLVNYNPILKKRIIDQTFNQIYKDDKKITFFSREHQSHAVTAINIFKDNFIIGSGPKTFRKICPESYSQYNGCTTHPHNFYLQLLSEVGVVGTIIPLTFFLLLVFKYIHNLIFVFKSSQKKNEVVYIYLCFIITMFPIIPTGNIFNNWLSIIFYIPLPFFLNYLKMDKK